MSFNGGGSSVGRVRDCDSRRRGFESHPSPHNINTAVKPITKYFFLLVMLCVSTSVTAMDIVADARVSSDDNKIFNKEITFNMMDLKLLVSEETVTPKIGPETKIYAAGSGWLFNLKKVRIAPFVQFGVQSKSGSPSQEFNTIGLRSSIIIHGPLDGKLSVIHRSGFNGPHFTENRAIAALQLNLLDRHAVGADYYYYWGSEKPSHQVGIFYKYYFL